MLHQFIDKKTHLYKLEAWLGPLFALTHKNYHSKDQDLITDAPITTTSSLFDKWYDLSSNHHFTVVVVVVEEMYW